MENIESAESVNVYDGQFKRFDRQSQRQHGAQGATGAEGPPACAVEMGLFVVESLSRVLAVLYSEEATHIRIFGIIFARARSQ